MLFLANTIKANSPNWMIFCFFIISLIAITCSVVIMRVLYKKRINLSKGFEAVGNSKMKYNKWNLVMVMFILFTGFIGALVSGGIFFGSL